MMQRFCGWGLILLILPLAGCGPSGNATSSDTSASDADGDSAIVQTPPREPAPTPDVEPVPVQPTADVRPQPVIPESPVALPAPLADTEFQQQVAQLYSAQVQQIVRESQSITSATRPGKSPVEIRQEVQRKLAEADQLRAPAIEYLQSQPELFDKLKAAMLDKSSDVRRGAAWYLFENIDRNDPQMVAVFVQALQDNDRTVRQLALAGVKTLPPQTLVEFLPILVALLEAGQEEDADRAAIAQLIGRLKTQAEPALEVLTRLGREDASSDVRLKCLYAASQITSDDKAVEMFRAALTDPSVEVRRMATLRLGRLSPSAVDAVDELSKALRDDDPRVREYAAGSLGNLGEGAAAAVDPLINTLTDPAPEVRRAAIAALSRLGPAAQRAIGPLQTRLNDPDPRAAELAQLALDVLQATP